MTFFCSAVASVPVPGGREPSPTLRDRIRLFECRSTSDIRANSPFAHRGRCNSPLLVRSAPTERSNVAESSRRRVTSTEISTPINRATPSLQTVPSEARIISPRKWNVITVGESTRSTAPARDKGKEKEMVTVLSVDDGELVSSDEEETRSSPRIQMPMLAKSPRRPSIEKMYEEEVIKLKRMTTEEKQMVKALIKLTTRKVS
jgi:hypothetical protein